MQLYARIDARFDAMLAAGALEEVAALAARQLDPLLPAMKAHGVPALIRPSQRRDHAARRPPRSAAPTPAIMPNGSSPGSGTNCRNSNGWRRRRRGDGFGARHAEVRLTDHDVNGRDSATLHAGMTLSAHGWNSKFALAERPEAR